MLYFAQVAIVIEVNEFLTTLITIKSLLQLALWLIMDADT